MREVIVGYAMLQYGSVMAWGRTVPSAERAVLPQGENEPPLLYWLDQLTSCATLEEFASTAERMRDELETWRRRPDPPPPGETLDDLKARVLSEGKGWDPKDVALSMRVTPTFVRNVRTEHDRDPETGYPDQRLKRALRLLREGELSLRQITAMTGVPKSTLHDAAKAA